MKLLHNIDFNYIFAHCDQAKFKIPYYYDSQEWKPGETYRMRISSIYDPSKFWIVLKERELDIFQDFINKFYQKYGDRYKISDITSISKNMYCAVFTQNVYFRGLIVHIPHSITHEKKAMVFLFDFGCSAMVNLENIYYLSEKLYHVPRFAVRASLYCSQPYSDFIWSDGVVKRFSELVAKKILLGVLECTDPKRKIVELNIGIVNEMSSVSDVCNILINEKLAKIVTSKKEISKVKNISRYSPKTKYPYLFPSFEAIEGGLVPGTVDVSEALRQCVARDILFMPYFTYTGSKN